MKIFLLLFVFLSSQFIYSVTSNDDLLKKKKDLFSVIYGDFINEKLGLKENEVDNFGNKISYDYKDTSFYFQICQKMPESTNEINSSIINEQLNSTFIEIKKYYDNFIIKILGEPYSNNLKGMMWKLNNFEVSISTSKNEIKYGLYDRFSLIQNIYVIIIKKNDIDQNIISQINSLDNEIKESIKQNIENKVLIESGELYRVDSNQLGIPMSIKAKFEKSDKNTIAIEVETLDDTIEIIKMSVKYFDGSTQNLSKNFFVLGNKRIEFKKNIKQITIYGYGVTKKTRVNIYGIYE
ncbi:MAG: hypothetical protein BWX59_01278 [Bacteroidetes bacterium ADurb.Bin028]|nr:MAG: hypothetical protein BWX59_01278 [Bacteroidetes bacterium ADurb.Bin028]